MGGTSPSPGLEFHEPHRFEVFRDLNDRRALRLWWATDCRHVGRVERVDALGDALRVGVEALSVTSLPAAFLLHLQSLIAAAVDPLGEATEGRSDGPVGCRSACFGLPGVVIGGFSEASFAGFVDAHPQTNAIAPVRRRSVRTAVSTRTMGCTTHRCIAECRSRSIRRRHHRGASSTLAAIQRPATRRCPKRKPVPSPPTRSSRRRVSGTQRHPQILGYGSPHAVCKALSGGRLAALLEQANEGASVIIAYDGAYGKVVRRRGRSVFGQPPESVSTPDKGTPMRPAGRPSAGRDDDADGEDDGHD
jgi:hypothetical protein